MTRKHGSGEHIDPELVADVVRNAMLEDAMRVEDPPSGLRLWRVSIMFAAMLVMLSGLAAFGRVMGWNP